MHSHYHVTTSGAISHGSCLVDIRPGVREGAVVHDVACFSRGGLTFDIVRDFSGVNCGGRCGIP
jgi:hypothetical protein